MRLHAASAKTTLYQDQGEREKTMVGARVKFPNSSECTPAEQALFCPAQRVIDLYNQDSGDKAKRICAKVRRWFFSAAAAREWAGVHFLKEVQSKHGHGCVLWRQPDRINIQVTVTREILVLRAEK